MTQQEFIDRTGLIPTAEEFATIHRGTASKGKTVVGNNCLIMAYCHVAHDCLLHDHIIMSNATTSGWNRRT